VVYDLVILGAGPAGMLTALATRVFFKNILILEQALPGGRLHHYLQLKTNNGTISTQEVMDQYNLDMRQHLLTTTYGEVSSLVIEKDIIHVQTNMDSYSTRYLVVATGTRDIPLTIPGAEHYLGLGISYCAACDGSFFKGKPIAVIIYALDQLEELLHLCALDGIVYAYTNALTNAVIHKFKKDHQLDNLFIMFDHQLIEVKGSDKGVTHLVSQAQSLIEQSVSAIFPLLGAMPNTEFLPHFLLDKEGYIITLQHGQTSSPNIWAVGDVVSTSKKNLEDIHHQIRALTQLIQTIVTKK
jgi:thioredoxin reductase (NADPH)